HDMAAMHFDGDFAQPDLGCDLFAHQPARDQAHDFALALGQRREMRLQVGNRTLMLTPPLVALDCGRDSIEKILIAKGLGQEIDGARFHRPHRHGDIAMAANEYDWNSNIRLRQLGLEVETTQAGQSDIEYEAAWHVRSRALQELLRRSKDFDPQLHGLEKPRQGLTHRGVVVNDEDDRL